MNTEARQNCLFVPNRDPDCNKILEALKPTIERIEKDLGVTVACDKFVFEDVCVIARDLITIFIYMFNVY